MPQEELEKHFSSIRLETGKLHVATRSKLQHGLELQPPSWNLAGPSILPSNCQYHAVMVVAVVLCQTAKFDSIWKEMTCSFWMKHPWYLCQCWRPLIDASEISLDLYNIPFGGKTFLLGDFRQTLPIVWRGHNLGITNYCVKSSDLWNVCQQYHLQQNMRLLRGQDQFNNFPMQLAPIECQWSKNHPRAALKSPMH